MIQLVLLMVGSFVLGLGSFAAYAEHVRARLARWQEELEHREWAVHLRETPGQLLPDPPEDRWGRGMAGVGAAAPAEVPSPPAGVSVPDSEPVGMPAPVESPLVSAVRAAWSWQDAEPVGGPGWLNGAVAAVGRWLVARPAQRVAEVLFDAVMLVLSVGYGLAVAVRRGLWRLGMWLEVPDGGLWRSLGRGWSVWQAFPPPIQDVPPRWELHRPSHRLRRGRKPLWRFLDDVKVREQERREVARQARMRAVQLDVWLSPDKEMPFEALTVEEQQVRFEESLEELLAYAELVGAGRG